MVAKCRAQGLAYRDWNARAQAWLQEDHIKARDRDARLNPPGAQQHRQQQAEERSARTYDFLCDGTRKCRADRHDEGCRRLAAGDGARA